jgi:hypothetical protein
MSNGESLQILQMVESGQVSVQDALGLLSTRPKTPAAPVAAGGQRWFRVRVTDLETGKGKVSVNIPLGWVKWGLALGARFAPELEEFDLEELVSALDEHSAGTIVEVEDSEDGERVEILVD